MSAEMYFQVEAFSGSSSWNPKWWHFARFRLPQDNLLFAALAGVRGDDSCDAAVESLSIKGLPDDISEQTIDEDSLTVDDEAARLEIQGTCTRTDADEWVRAGHARYLHDGWSVTHPDMYSHSWASLDELELAVSRYERAGGKNGAILRSVLAAMESLHSAGIPSRSVFWFGG
jgi:hypothetical protein